MADPSQPARLVELDGRTLEGGGQLLRVALCLSALTRTPLKITDIRGKRAGGGGLKAQHVACFRWLAKACGARDLAEVGQKEITFTPVRPVAVCGYEDVSPVFKKVVKDGKSVYETRLDIGTAGSTGLALQAILPFILFSKLPSDLPVHLTISGGTNVSGSPSYEYISQVLLPTLAGIGFPLMTIQLGKRGWSHGGGSSIGNFTLEIPPRLSTGLPAFKWRPENTDIKPILRNLHGSFLGPKSSHDSFRNHLTKLVPTILTPKLFNDQTADVSDILTLTCEESGHDKRLYFILVATLSDPAQPSKPYKLASDLLHSGPKNNIARAANETATRVVSQLTKEISSGTWVDSHMRDQLVIFQALAQGSSEIWPGICIDDRNHNEEEKLREPSMHARTAEWVAKRLLGARFDAEGGCEGVGFGT